MYNKTKPTITKMIVNEGYEGETIEKKIRRIVNNNEPIKDGAPLIYSERKDGVQPGYDIRTDRWEVAVDAMDKISKTHQAKREERHETEEQKTARKLAEDAKKGMQKEGEA